MSTELIINASLPETRIALMEEGEIQELLIERASGKGIVGNIYKGRVTRVLPGMQAAFVDIGLEKAAFLYVDDVYVHSDIWEREEGASRGETETVESAGETAGQPGPVATAHASTIEAAQTPESQAAGEGSSLTSEPNEFPTAEAIEGEGFSEDFDEEDEIPGAEDEEDDDEDKGPTSMGPGPDEGDDNSSAQGSGEGSQGGPQSVKEQPAGTMAPSEGDDAEAGGDEGPEGSESDDDQQAGAEGGSTGEGEGQQGRRRRRGRRGGRNRRRGERQRDDREGQQEGGKSAGAAASSEEAPTQFQDQVRDEGRPDSDRAELSVQAEGGAAEGSGRPSIEGSAPVKPQGSGLDRSEFNQQRSSDRRIRSKQAARPVRAQVNIQDLLKEGQEVIVQVAKDPIATKGARLTCHISLPGRHLVCMPTIDHVGVSRRIERDDERRKLRDFVERNRPKNLGFIVRTASGRGQYERRIKQDIDYLTRLWNEIREKAASVTAPALVYEDLNSVLRAIRDWVTEDIDKIVVDSRYHFNEIQRFCSHFMPVLKQKVDLYHGDIPIFDAYNISTELARALERKVWLKSGGYIVIDQAEALVAIDVNTGRYVGKKNLEDTILKTNLEAVQEIAYQLRLRNCGGIIILDLIDMEKEENKHRVYRALEEALKKDRARPTIQKISDLGLIEMTRKRTRDTIVRSLCEPCAHCEGKGFIKSKQTVAYEILREMEREGIERDVQKVLVQAHPDVIDILAIDEKETLDQLERRYRKQILLQAVIDSHPEQFEVFGDKKEGGRASSARPGKETQQSRGRDRERDRDREKEREREGRESRESRESRDSRDRGQERGDRGERSDRGERDRDRDRGRRGRDRNRDRNRDRDRGNQGAQQPQAQFQPGESAGEGIQPVREAQATDLDAIGNRVDGGSASYAESAGPIAGTENTGSVAAPGAPKTEEDFYSEEDRLAFLRAQAAQDAALARLRGGGDALSMSNRPGGKSGGQRTASGQAQGQATASAGAAGGAPQGQGGNRDRRGGRRGRRGRGGRNGNPSGGQQNRQFGPGNRGGSQGGTSGGGEGFPGGGSAGPSGGGSAPSDGGGGNGGGGGGEGAGASSGQPTGPTV